MLMLLPVRHVGSHSIDEQFDAPPDSTIRCGIDTYASHLNLLEIIVGGSVDQVAVAVELAAVAGAVEGACMCVTSIVQHQQRRASDRITGHTLSTQQSEARGGTCASSAKPRVYFSGEWACAQMCMPTLHSTLCVLTGRTALTVIWVPINQAAQVGAQRTAPSHLHSNTRQTGRRGAVSAHGHLRVYVT